MNLIYFNLNLTYFNLNLTNFKLNLTYFNLNLNYFKFDLTYFKLNLIYFNLNLIYFKLNLTYFKQKLKRCRCINDSSIWDMHYKTLSWSSNCMVKTIYIYIFKEVSLKDRWTLALICFIEVLSSFLYNFLHSCSAAVKGQNAEESCKLR